MKLKFVLASVVFVLCASQTALQAEAVAATVSSVTGIAHVTNSSGHSKELSTGDTIPAGCTISTGTDSTVGLKLVPGATTVITPGTVIKLTKLDYSVSGSGTKLRTIRINLEHGKLVSSLIKHDGKSDFVISTPKGSAKAVGTDWAVSYSPDSGLSVSTADGAVTITLPDGTTVVVPGGQVTTSPDGTTTVTGDMTSDQIAQIYASITDAGFNPAGGSTSNPGNNNSYIGAGNFVNNNGTSNPANVSSQPVTSPN